MNRWIAVLIGVLLLSVIIISWEGRERIEISQVCYSDHCFNVEIADDDSERTRGLMFREELCSDCGMLFIYPETGNYKFWMKNTLIPLDIIWLDSELKVVYIASAVPCVSGECELYGPPDGEEARYVLELNSGVSEEKNLGIGDKVEFGYE